MIKKTTKNKILMAFLLSALLGALIVLPNIIINKGIYSLTKDLSFEQIPFNKVMNDGIKNGEIFWTWYNDLGSNFIGTFSFYNLFSPFNLIGFLFPASIFEYLIGPLYILKYAVSGLTSYLFLKRYVKNKNYALVGSLLYTFSGYMLTNTLFFHFHDVVAFFPLLLYSLDALIYDNKKCYFALSIALCAFTNWFFFIGECVFLVLYFLVKILTKEYKITVSKFITIIIEGLMGVTLAALVLIPCALFTLGNTRLSNKWTLSTMLTYPLKDFTEIIRAFIFPSEVMSIRGALSEYNYKSIELYLPVVGITLAFTYLIKNKKKWESLLTIILCIFMFIPILNSSFILFQSEYYARWFFMPTLVLSLMSIKSLENKDNIKSGVIVTVLLALIFFINLIILKDMQIIYDKPYFIMTIVFMIINLILTIIITKTKNKTKILIASIFIFITIWGNMNVYYYKEKNIKTNDMYYTYLKSNEIIQLEKNIRTNSTETCDYNYGYILKNNNLRTFNSNINASAFEFYKSVGKKRKVKTKVDIKNKELNNFLGVKYIISCDSENLSKYGYKLYETKEPYKIYINEDYKQFGFPVNKFISVEDFKQIEKEGRINILKDTAVLNEEQINKYKNLQNQNVKYIKNEFEFTKNGFKSRIESTGETLGIFAFPFDKGWTAKVNGKEVEIESVDNGLIGIKINKGMNEIELNYITPGLRIGLLISVVSLVAFIIYFIRNKKMKIKNDGIL